MPVPISQQQIDAIVNEDNLQNKIDSVSALENAGISIPNSLKKELLGDDADSETRSRVIPGSGLDTLINVTSWFDALEGISEDVKPRSFLPESKSSVQELKATSSLKPIPLEQTSELLETSSIADKQQGLLDDIRRGRDFEPKPKRKPSLLSNRSSLAIQTQEKVNSFDVPSLNTKEGRGVVAKFKSEVKEQLGVTLSKADTRKIVTGLVDPTDEQIQTILKVLEENAPQKRLVDPDEKTIEKLLDILGTFSPIAGV
jgi:hypothetical protein